MRMPVHLLFLCVIALLCESGFALSVRVIGRILDSQMRRPLPNVSVTFRTGQVTQTDSAGVFSYGADLEMDYPLRLFLVADGYADIQAQAIVASTTLDFGDILMEPFRAQSVPFCGDVADSVTLAPIPGIPVDFLHNTGDMDPFMKTVTDSMGAFCLQIPVNNSVNGRAFWRISIPGYYVKIAEVRDSANAMRIPIRMQPIGSILLEARGKVVDSVTSFPIPNAMVVLGTNYFYAKPDTSFTSEAGYFKRKVQAGIASSLYPVLYCNVSAGEYQKQSQGFNILTTPEFYFGEIRLIRTPGSQVGTPMPRPRMAFPEAGDHFDGNGRRTPLGATGNGLSGKTGTRTWTKRIPE